MRNLRIGLAVVLILGGLGAFYTVVRALGTQTSWEQAADKAVADVAAAEKDLPALEAKERSLKNQLAAANANFGTPLFAADPQINGDGSVVVNLGTQDGLARPEDAPPGTGPIVHVFAPTGEGTASVYVGPFAVLEARERQASLAPAFDVQPGEPQTWPVGRGDWRLRFDVPASRDVRFLDLDATLLTQRETLKQRLNTLEDRRRSVAEAEAALADRERELFGDPDAPEIADAPGNPRRRGPDPRRDRRRTRRRPGRTGPPAAGGQECPRPPDRAARPERAAGRVPPPPPAPRGPPAASNSPGAPGAGATLPPRHGRPMGFENRDYAWDSSSRRAFLGGGDAAVKAIVIANAAIYFLQLITANAPSGLPAAYGGPLTAWLGLVPDRVLFGGEIWRLFTYAWLHAEGDFWHILINMYLLFIFGKRVEQRIGTREFALFYCVAALAGGVFFTLLEACFPSAGSVDGVPLVCVGASGAVMAVVALVAIWEPQMQILLFFIIPVPLWALAGFYALWESYYVLAQIGSGFSDGTAHGAHFGGLLLGLAYHRFGWNFDDAFAGLTDRLPRVKLGSAGRPKRGKPALRVHRPEDDDPEGDLDRVADAVLAKITATGEASLTAEERAVLKEASARAKAKRERR